MNTEDSTRSVNVVNVQTNTRCMNAIFNNSFVLDSAVASVHFLEFSEFTSLAKRGSIGQKNSGTGENVEHREKLMERALPRPDEAF